MIIIELKRNINIIKKEYFLKRKILFNENFKNSMNFKNFFKIILLSMLLLFLLMIFYEILGILGITTDAYGFYKHVGVWLYYMILGFILGFIIRLALPYLIFLYLKKNGIYMLNDIKSIHYTFSDESLIYSDDIIKKLEIQWSGVKSYMVKKENIFILISESVLDAFVIAKNEVDDQNYKEIIELLKSKVVYKN